jgi:hypothetical protein
LCDLFGDYRQGHESFDEGEPDPADSTGASAGLSEPAHEVRPAVVPAPVAAAQVHPHHRIVHRKTVHYAKRKPIKKKPPQNA